MKFFDCADAPEVLYCGTAQMIQKEVVRLRNLKLPGLHGVTVIVRYRVDAHSNDTFVITFSHTEMDELKKGVIRTIVQGETFNLWLRKSLKARHRWGGLRIRVSGREKKEEYVWSVENTAK